jgi:hypothetical protein
MERKLIEERVLYPPVVIVIFHEFVTEEKLY